MTLLHMLNKQPGLEMVVAHFDHGIRPDSGEDAQLVESVAASYGLPFYVEKGKLGANTSEEKARQARYDFFYKLVKGHGADGIITAHHQDDLIETALMNILRGTGYRGLVAMQSNPKIVRPLLNMSKQEILNYAKVNKLAWREDPSNDDQTYLRNYIRHNITSRLSPAQRSKLLSLISQTEINSKKIEVEAEKILHKIYAHKKMDRNALINLPTQLSLNLLAAVLRQLPGVEIDKSTVERLLTAIKTAKAGSRHDIAAGYVMELNSHTALIRGK